MLRNVAHTVFIYGLSHVDSYDFKLHTRLIINTCMHACMPKYVRFYLYALYKAKKDNDLN